MRHRQERRAQSGDRKLRLRKGARAKMGFARSRKMLQNGKGCSRQTEESSGRET